MKPLHSSKRGLTLLELTVSAGLFLVVTTVLLSAFFQGVKAWRQGEQRSTLLNDAQSVFSDIEWELESSHLGSVEWSNDPGILSFASPFGTRESAGRDAFSVDSTTGALRWSKYVLVHHDPTSKTVKKNEWAIPAGSTAESTPQVLSGLDLGSGIQPLSFYAGGGRDLADDVQDFRIKRLGHSIEMTLKLENEKGRSLEFVSSTRVRN